MSAKTVVLPKVVVIQTQCKQDDCPWTKRVGEDRKICMLPSCMRERAGDD